MKMKLKLHIADTRGVAEHDWLSSRHTFSFAGYHNPERMRFGLLREINDDVVQPGMGFGTHLHDDMEIISIPLAGKLRHRDSMGHTQNITVGEVQIMSAGTGITHSEYNGSESEFVNFLQIWVFPEKRGIEPHYDQKLFSVDGRQGRLQNIVSPDQNDGGVWINQQSWFWLGDFKAGQSDIYPIKKSGNGVYIFALEGMVSVASQQLECRDGIGVEGTETVDIKATENCHLLVIDVPLH
jgi:redox-sensitive bicupin YhaK (pirin superfamily)